MRFLTEFAVAFGRVAASKLQGAANAILANVELLKGDEGARETSADEPLYGQIGFYCRPMPPVAADAADGLNPEGEAEVVALRVGDQVIPFTGRDLRLNAQVNPQDGHCGMAHYGGGFFELGWNASKNGTMATLYTLRKTSGGAPDKAHVFTMNTEEASSSIILLHEAGQSITMGPDGQTVLCNAGGNGFIEVKDDGKIVLNGAAISVVGGAMVGSQNPADGDFVMLATQLLAWIGQANAAFAAIAAAAGANPNPTITAPVAVPVPATMLKAK